MFLLGTANVVGGWMAIVVVVCGNICGKMCGNIEKLLDQNKIWYGTRYGSHDYDSGDKKTNRQKDKKTKRQKGKKAKRQKGKNAKRQKDKKAIRQKDKETKRNDKYKKIQKRKKTTRKKKKKNRGPEGPPCPLQELEQGGHGMICSIYEFVMQISTWTFMYVSSVLVSMCKLN